MRWIKVWITLYRWLWKYKRLSPDCQSGDICVIYSGVNNLQGASRCLPERNQEVMRYITQHRLQHQLLRH